MKQATTVEQQIKTFRNRGMLIDMSEDKAKEILSDIGYFRLGFYCFPFETSYPNRKNRTHQYKPGTKFSDAVSLYYFDVDLRNILSKYINRIEINFRTNIVYRVSNQYRNSSTWFVDPAVMQKDFIDKFDKEVYTENFKKNSIIKNHHKKYINDKYAPAWKTLEFFTFGAMVNLYKNIKDVNLNRQISMQYGIRNEKILENYLKGIVEIRNICAHGAVLFDHALYNRLKNGPIVNITTENANQMFTIIQIICFIMNSISQNRANDLKKEIKLLFDRYENNNIIRCIIEKCIGYQNIF